MGAGAANLYTSPQSNSVQKELTYVTIYNQSPILIAVKMECDKPTKASNKSQSQLNRTAPIQLSGGVSSVNAAVQLGSTMNTENKCYEEYEYHNYNEVIKAGFQIVYSGTDVCFPMDSRIGYLSIYDSEKKFEIRHKYKVEANTEWIFTPDKYIVKKSQKLKSNDIFYLKIKNENKYVRHSNDNWRKLIYGQDYHGSKFQLECVEENQYKIKCLHAHIQTWRGNPWLSLNTGGWVWPYNDQLQLYDFKAEASIFQFDDVGRYDELDFKIKATYQNWSYWLGRNKNNEVVLKMDKIDATVFTVQKE